MIGPAQLARIFLTQFLIFPLGATFSGGEAIPLQGEWAFRLDPDKKGMDDRWFVAELPDRIHLPGSIDEAKVAPPNPGKPSLMGLYRPYPYAGAAWYQHEVEIPEDWRGKRITLLLERCRWETRAWLDEQDFGSQDLLCTPQIVDFGTALQPGKHRLTIWVDNTIKFDLGTWISSSSEMTQTNWNGIIGQLELRATDPVWVESLQVYPDVVAKMVRVRVHVGNAANVAATGMLELTAAEKERKPGKTGAVPLQIEIPIGGKTIEAEVRIGDEARLWDEFSPVLYTMTASLKTRAGQHTYTDQKSERFGMRQLGITANGHQFLMNGRTIYLRGTLDCCIFPLTGYPAMDVAAWARIFRICRAHGLNHMRFHSWCPPEAAFIAADEAGIMLQVEPPQANVDQGKNPNYDRFIAEEVRAILAAYGNHPSFCFLSMGNEISGAGEPLERLVDYCIKEDPRHLYTSVSNGTWRRTVMTANRQFTVTPKIRGVEGEATNHDFRSLIGEDTRPQISHEVGQWAVFPRMAEISKYTGALQPGNFEIIRDQLKERGLLDQAEDFTQASGKLSALLYKEAIEVLLRTPEHAGFQLLQLHDYPGQGTALVGMLDAFWDSKGFITPEEFRRFCSPTVPLMRLKKRIYATNEVLSATAEVSHFGATDIKNAQPAWALRDDKGRVINSGQLSSQTIHSGTLTRLGEISVDLSKVPAPARLTLSLALEGTEAANDWHIWVYATDPLPEAPKDVYVSNRWDATTTATLAAGGKVLLLAPRISFAHGKWTPGKFLPVYWSPAFFNLFSKGPMGLLCDNKHPALAAFPSETNADWQWRDLLNHSTSINLDGTPEDFHPIVQVIDDFTNNRRLANLFEARVGQGRLLVCSIDLWENLDQRPAARQMLRSLYAYVATEQFRPAQQLDWAVLSSLFGENGLLPEGCIGIRADGEAPNHEAALAVDGDPLTFWHSGGQRDAKGFPHELCLEFSELRSLKGCRLQQREEGGTDGSIKDYAIYVSTDGKEWGEPVAEGSLLLNAQRQTIMFAKTIQGRFLKMVALSSHGSQPFATLAELGIL